MASANNPSSQWQSNKMDALVDNKPELEKYLMELRELSAQLREVHTKEKQKLAMEHGNNLQRIFKECAEEPKGLQELRTRSCTNRYERERDALTDVHGRIELYREVKSKHDYESRFQGREYPLKEGEKMLEKRAERFTGMEQEKGTDQLHLNQEREHDLLVKSYLEGSKNYDDFAREYNQMIDRHLAGSTPVHEKQLEPLKYVQKSPEIENE